MTIALMTIVERAVKVLDFVGTVYFYHFVFTLIISGFPSLRWFLFNTVFFIILAFVGEYGCLKQETAEIKLSFGSILGKTNEKGSESKSK